MRAGGDAGQIQRIIWHQCLCLFRFLLKERAANAVAVTISTCSPPGDPDRSTFDPRPNTVTVVVVVVVFTSQAGGFAAESELEFIRIIETGTESTDFELAAARRPQAEDGRSDGLVEERPEILEPIIGNSSRLVEERLNVPRCVDVRFSERPRCTKMVECHKDYY